MGIQGESISTQFESENSQTKLVVEPVWPNASQNAAVPAVKLDLVDKSAITSSSIPIEINTGDPIKAITL